MQLTFTTLLTLTLTLLTTAISSSPIANSSPQPTTVSYSCPGGSYEQCLATKFCIQLWPESCYCANKNKLICAKQCGKDPRSIKLQKCPPIPSPAPEEPSPEECYDQCVSERVCILSFPAGCICQNGVKKDCSLQCGVPTPELDDCTL